MAYTAFDGAKPDASTQNGTAFAQSTRDNLLALRDALVTTGIVQGFNYAPTGGTAEQPATAYWKRSTECVKAVLTWGTSGGEDGNVTKAALYYAPDESHGSFPTSTNGTYSAMADASGNYVVTMTYDSNGNCTASTWGSTP